MESSRDTRILRRRMPIGAEVQADGGVHFRLWAPKCRRVVVEFPNHQGTRDAPSVELSAEEDGYFSGIAPTAQAGWLYGFRLDDADPLLPDPASRFQPDGPHGLSRIEDPATYEWHDTDWPGVLLRGQVIYELHIGTLTDEGTWEAACHQLPALADLGVTLLEVMPVADFPGEFGWGYDGVNLFAPTRLYGQPDDFRRFVDQAHGLGMGVLLDVVYNHFGPRGNYLGRFSDDFVSKRHHTDWGEAINFDGPRSRSVREYFLANAAYWVDEFHIDGLRLDAVQAIFDDSADSILAAIGRSVRRAAGRRGTLVYAENELQDARLARSPEHGGLGLDGVWNDDFHHVARVALTGHNEYYFRDYHGSPQELISAVKWGYLYQGQWNARQEKHRGTPALDIEAARFVTFLQNHDQVGNSPQGRRCHEMTSPGRHRAMTALWLLTPGTPLLFQGQEFSASTPFHYFADHEPDLGMLVREGRHKDLCNFGRHAGSDARHLLADPCDRQTFVASKLDPSERLHHVAAVALHRDLLRLRREDPVFSTITADRIHGIVLAAEAFALRYLTDDGIDRLILVNLGRDLAYRPAADPLLAPPADRHWALLWSSESPRYGGGGTTPLDLRTWLLPGHATIVLGATASSNSPG